MKNTLIAAGAPDRARAALDACYVKTEALQAVMEAAQKAAEQEKLPVVLLSGGAGSGRTTLAWAMASLLRSCNRLRDDRALTLFASELRGAQGVSRLRASLEEARKQGRMLVLEGADALCIFPEEDVRALLKTLRGGLRGTALVMTVYDKMHTAFLQLIYDSLPAPVEIALEPLPGAKLPQVVRELAHKRWMHLEEAAEQAIAQRSQSGVYVMQDAVRLLTALRMQVQQRCHQADVPLGTQAWNQISVRDVQNAWAMAMRK